MSRSGIHGPSSAPRFVVERAAAAAMEAAEIQLRGEGAALTKMVVLLWADAVPADEPDCTTTGHGYEDAIDLTVEVFAHFAGAMKQLGKEVKLVPVEQAHGSLQ